MSDVWYGLLANLDYNYVRTPMGWVRYLRLIKNRAEDHIVSG